jgi:hypothetical protein
MQESSEAYLSYMFMGLGLGERPVTQRVRKGMKRTSQTGSLEYSDSKTLGNLLVTFDLRRKRFA